MEQAVLAVAVVQVEQAVLAVAADEYYQELEEQRRLDTMVFQVQVVQQIIPHLQAEKLKGPAVVAAVGVQLATFPWRGVKR